MFLYLGISSALNTIQVYEIGDEELGRRVPFDIQVAGEDKYRIVPNSSNYEFFIAYYCLVKTKKIVIKAEDIPRYKNMDDQSLCKNF